LLNTGPGFWINPDPKTDIEDLAVKKIFQVKKFHGCGSGFALILDAGSGSA
jgi:hypothetical protein